MTFEVIRYEAAHESVWDRWCDEAVNSTFLHTRRFLGYHGDRFDDESVLLFESGRLAGVVPAAATFKDSHVVSSHPGATYGGIVHDGRLVGERMIEALALLQMHFQERGYRVLSYKAVPHIYSRVPSQDDLYALFRRGATLMRSDLSSAIDLTSQRMLSERRRRALKKAQQSVVVATEGALLHDLWSIVTDNLQRKHAAKPVHTLDEMALLMARFPQNICTRCGVIAGQVEAGIVLFRSPNVWHAQYIGSSEAGYATSALDAVFDSAIGEAREAGVRYFDFGTSNEDQGRVLNEGLYKFKSEFGGGGVAHQHFELPL